LARWRTAAVIAGVVTGTLTIALVVLIALSFNRPSYETHVLASDLPDIAYAYAFAIVGVIVTLKRPGNLVGWALVLAGVGSIVEGVLDFYARLALFVDPSLGLKGGPAAEALSDGSWTALMAGVFLLLATFPTGTLPFRRMRRYVVLVLLGFAIVWFGLSTTEATLPSPFSDYANPLALTRNGSYFIPFKTIDVGVLLAVVLVSIRAVVRFLRSHGLEREQSKWLAASAGLLVATFPVAAAFRFSQAAGVAFSIALIALPVSVGIAVLRYRLYEIDRIISRTLVYGLLTVVLGATYFGLVVAAQALFSSFAGGSNLAIAVSTLVVAALFVPVRSRLQGLVDRRFYRRRYDAQRTLERFGGRLREQTELDALTGELSGVVLETMQPGHVTVWLRGGTTS
jgi:hypothetical protein